MSMVFQHFALFPHMTILENVAYGLRIQGVEVDRRNEAAAEALQTVGLEGWEDSLPEQMSGGMKQRVGLSGIFVVTRDGYFRGYVDADTPIREIFELMYEKSSPMAVVDEDGFLKGVIVRGAVIGGLATRGSLEQGA